jgi:Primase C terminal 2 (PriCT-2)
MMIDNRDSKTNLRSDQTNDHGLADIKFLKFIFSGITGYVDVRLIYPQRDRRPVRAFFRVEDVTKIEEFIATHPGANVFFGVTPRIGKTNGTLANCGGLMWLWADLDFKISGEAQARRQLASFPLPPSITVRSGGGLHLYWRLMAPLDLTDKEVCAYAKRLLRAIAIELGADLTAAEPARVLRVPGTFNFKYSPPRVAAVDTLGPEIQYSIADFEKALAAHLKHEPPHAAARTIANDHQHTEGNHLLNIAAIEDALGFVDADPYDTWLAIGMALHHHFGGAAEGFKLWTAWSQGSDKFDAEAQRKKWESFSLSGNSAGTIRIASLFKLARDNGWSGSKPNQRNGTHSGSCHREGPGWPLNGTGKNEAASATTNGDSGNGGKRGTSDEPDLPTKYNEQALSNRLVNMALTCDLSMANGGFMLRTNPAGCTMNACWYPHGRETSAPRQRGKPMTMCLPPQKPKSRRIPAEQPGRQ